MLQSSQRKYQIFRLNNPTMNTLHPALEPLLKEIPKKPDDFKTGNPIDWQLSRGIFNAALFAVTPILYKLQEEARQEGRDEAADYISSLLQQHSVDKHGMTSIHVPSFIRNGLFAARHGVKPEGQELVAARHPTK